jgi:hypothetical protein
MPNDKLGGAIKRRSCRETAIIAALPNGHSFHGGTEGSNPFAPAERVCESPFHGGTAHRRRGRGGGSAGVPVAEPAVACHFLSETFMQRCDPLGNEYRSIFAKGGRQGASAGTKSRYWAIRKDRHKYGPHYRAEEDAGTIQRREGRYPEKVSATRLLSVIGGTSRLTAEATLS